MRQHRVIRALSVLYLFLFFLSELYSAFATAMDKPIHLAAWEQALGFGFLLIPGTLLIGVILLLTRRISAGFYLGLVSVLLYAAFFVAEAFAERNSPSTATLESSSLLYGGWALAFILAVVALTFLRGRSGNERLS